MPESRATVGEPEYDATVQYLEEQAAQSPVAESLEQLPHVVARGLIYLVLAFVVVALLFAALQEISIYRAAQAIVVPTNNLQNIQADCDGVLEILHVGEGDHVEAGERVATVVSREVVLQISNWRTTRRKLKEAEDEFENLVPLRQNKLTAQIAILKNRERGFRETLSDLERQRRDLRADRELALRTRIAEMEREKAELARHEIAVQGADNALALAEEELESTRTLYEQKGISELEWKKAVLALDAAQNECLRCGSVVLETQKAMEISARKYASLMRGYEQSEADLDAEALQIEISLMSVESELSDKASEQELLAKESERDLKIAEEEEARARSLVLLSFPGITPEELEKLQDQAAGLKNTTDLRAPYRGTIGKLLVRNTGESVVRGQTVMTLIPSDEVFRAEILISNKDMGRMDAGLTVRYKFDAFPHVEYGVNKGTITEIVTDPELDSQGNSVYRAYATLDQQAFPGPGGSEFPLKAGMTATAEIKTHSKTLLELMLEPLRELGPPRDAVGGDE